MTLHVYCLMLAFSKGETSSNIWPSALGASSTKPARNVGVGRASSFVEVDWNPVAEESTLIQAPGKCDLHVANQNVSQRPYLPTSC